MTNSFDDENGEFLILVNDEEQYSLWPASHAIPAGWTAATSADTRQRCLDYINTHWTDMRPASLVRAMKS